MAKSNVEIGVSGIAEFKRGINDAKASLKALDAEAATASAQFRASGDSQEYLATKAKLTQQQMAAQQKIIENCQKAMAKFTTEESKNSAAYQALRTQMANAQTAMIGLKSQTDETGDSMEEAASDTDKLAEAIGKIGKKVSFGNVLTVIKDIGNIAKNAIGGVIDFGKAIVSAGANAAQAADDLATAAVKYDMTMQELQRWQLASKLMDADTEAIIKARSRILDDATKSTNGVLVLDADSTDFDVAVTDARGNMRDIQDIFWDTVETLGRMEDATKRDAKAMELFGRSFMEVKTLFKEGAREKWTEILETAGGNTDEEWENLKSYNDELDKLRYNAEVAKYSALAALAPAFEEGAGSLNVLLGKLTDFIRSDAGQKFFERIGNGITAIFDSISEEDIDGFFDKLENEIFPSINKFLDTLPDKIRSGMGLISDVFNGLMDIIVWINAGATNGMSITDMLFGGSKEASLWRQGPQAYADYIRQTEANMARYEAERAAALESATAEKWAQQGANAPAQMQANRDKINAFFDGLDEVEAAAQTIPQAAADTIAEGIPDVAAQAAALGAAVSAALAQNLTVPGGTTNYNTSNTNNFNINNGLDAQAAMDYASAVNQRQTAGYGG